ncbi:glycosyltransferase involved in cell wall biosynthesis [Chryseobacterium rhizosphaerae]|uniref:glycosyltransferase n=1 Tax=Chryseobacterium rhizosphaerae TaxID=395937 RepID=UPI002858AD1E|nr:glycosyltransferase [Chryseobacterium rhizosphaerae]MDR6544432.1 glycosyltransferase involved in cell wall biosynthesis [Chryseobacterium rhizosphaerae]
MSDHPLVSVIMITYGHEKFVEQAISSIIQQNYDGNIEIIIANDHSPDNTDEVIVSFLEKAKIPENFIVKYTRHEKNKGIMQNFSWALTECRGKYNAICDGDDYWIDPLKIQKQVDFLEKNPDYSIHSGLAQLLENGNLTTFIGNPLRKKTYEIKDFFSKNNLISCTCMFRKNKIDFHYLENIYFGDWMVYINTLNSFPNSKAYVSDECYSVYRVNDMGTMAQITGIGNDEKHFSQILRIQQLFKTRYTPEDVKLINRYTLNLYVYYLLHHQFKKMLTTVLKNFKLVRFNFPIRKYLSYFRYRKHLSTPN